MNAVFEEMAAKVDAQNADNPKYAPMAGHPESMALQAALSLVFEGMSQPNGYCEPLVHAWRPKVKERQGVGS